MQPVLGPAGFRMDDVELLAEEGRAMLIGVVMAVGAMVWIYTYIGVGSAFVRCSTPAVSLYVYVFALCLQFLTSRVLERISISRPKLWLQKELSGFRLVCRLSCGL